MTRDRLVLLVFSEFKQFPLAVLASSKFSHSHCCVLLLKKVLRIKLFDGL